MAGQGQKVPGEVEQKSTLEVILPRVSFFVLDFLGDTANVPLVSILNRSLRRNTPVFKKKKKKK